MDLTELRDLKNLGLDRDGYIVRTVDREKITPPFEALIEAVRERSVQHFGARLHSFYIYGSVARGTAVPNKSDLDALAILKDSADAGDQQFTETLDREMRAVYPFTREVGLVLAGLAEVEQPDELYGWGCFLKIDCACIHGIDLTEKFPRYKPSLAIAKGLNRDLPDFLQRCLEIIDKSEHAGVRNNASKTILKKILRTGFSLHMAKIPAWTTDVRICARVFAAFHPEKTQEIAFAVQLLATREWQRKEVLPFLRSFGEWTIREFERATAGV